VSITGGIIGGLLLAVAFIDALMRTHEQHNAILREAFAEIDERRSRRNDR
jgi:hypothetical protein